MKTLSLRRTLALAMCSCILFVGQVTGVAAAATSSATTNKATNNANSLKISPLRTDITVEKGQSGTVRVQVTNLTSAPITLKAIENDFVAGDEKGTPALILDENSYAPSHSLKRFMVPVPNVSIGANSSQQIDVKIQVPKTAQAGGYYGAIRFTPANAGNQPLDVGSSVTSLILLTVPGPTVEQLLLTNFDVQQNGGTASNFRTPNDLSLLVRFQNRGNIQEQPFGQINIQKGSKVVYTTNFNQDQPRDNVLPDSARRWTVPLKNLGKFGKYTVSGTFGYGSKGQTINIEKTVWIIPTSYILTVVGIVVLVLLVGFGSFLFLRSYKRKILKSSRRRY